MQRANIKARASLLAMVLVTTASLLMSSCLTTQESELQPTPAELEFVATLEQTREIVIEEKLKQALSRLFGADNVIVLVALRAQYGSSEERHGMDSSGDEPRWEFHRESGPGGVERLTVSIIINENALTQEQKSNREELRETLSQMVADGAGMMLSDESADRVSILFMPLIQ